jgi:signal recognition particle subunit SEC65
LVGICQLRLRPPWPPGGGDPRPDRYLDPVSLGSLIVSVATLAWTIYNDQRSRAQERKSEANRAIQERETESIARQVRMTLRERDVSLPPGTERITEVVASEIIRQSGQPRE